MFGKIKLSILGLIMVSCSPIEMQEPAPEGEDSIALITNLPYYNSPDFNPIWDKSEMVDLHQIGPFDFTDQNGNEVNKSTVEGCIYLSNFFFTSCGSICPKMIGNMEYVQNELSECEDVMFLSHTVLPEVDTVEKLKVYSENFEVNDERWRFLTGNKSEIYELARKSYFAEEEIGFNKDSTEFLHTEHFILVDKNHHIRGIYNGTIQLEMDRVVEDIKLLRAEG